MQHLNNLTLRPVDKASPHLAHAYMSDLSNQQICGSSASGAWNQTHQGRHGSEQDTVVVVQICHTLGTLLNAVKALATNQGICRFNKMTQKLVNAVEAYPCKSIRRLSTMGENKTEAISSPAPGWI